MSMEIAYLKTHADALACARRLAEKAQADGRHLSYAEQTAFDRKMADARRYAEQIKQHRGDEAARDEDHDVGLAGGRVHRRHAVRASTSPTATSRLGAKGTAARSSGRYVP